MATLSIKDNWRGTGRWARVSAWMNQVGKWFNRLVFEGPLEETRDSCQWKLRHSLADSAAADVADSSCRVLGPVEEEVVGEGAEAADETEIDVGAAATYVRDYRLVRVGYFHAGDKKLYGYYRAYTYDPYGHLQTIGPETRVEIDATEACS